MTRFAVLFERYLRDLSRLRLVLFFNLFSSVFFFCVFVGTFGNLAGPAYAFTVMPLALLSASFGAASSFSAAVTADFTSGFVNRLLATGCSATIIIAAPMAANLLFVAIYGLIIFWLAVALSGFHIPPGGIAGAFACLPLAAGWGVALSSAGLLFGSLTRNAQTAQLAALALFYPLTYLSPALISEDLMQPWLRHLVVWNPTTYIVAAMRSALSGQWTSPMLFAGYGSAIVLATGGLLIAGNGFRAVINRG